MAPAGLEAFLAWGRRVRGWQVDKARPVFSIGLVLLALALSGFILFGRFRPGQMGGVAWNDPYYRYLGLEHALQSLGVPKDAIVLVNNSPGYTIASRRPAISIPYGDIQTVCSVAWRYQAGYLLLEMDQIIDGSELYEHPADRQCLHYIDTISDVRLFQVLDPG